MKMKKLLLTTALVASTLATSIFTGGTSSQAKNYTWEEVEDYLENHDPYTNPVTIGDKKWVKVNTKRIFVNHEEQHKVTITGTPGLKLHMQYGAEDEWTATIPKSGKLKYHFRGDDLITAFSWVNAWDKVNGKLNERDFSNEEEDVWAVKHRYATARFVGLSQILSIERIDGVVFKATCDGEHWLNTVDCDTYADTGITVYWCKELPCTYVTPQKVRRKWCKKLGLNLKKDSKKTKFGKKFGTAIGAMYVKGKFLSKKKWNYVVKNYPKPMLNPNFRFVHRNITKKKVVSSKELKYRGIWQLIRNEYCIPVDGGWYYPCVTCRLGDGYYTPAQKYNAYYLNNAGMGDY